MRAKIGNTIVGVEVLKEKSVLGWKWVLVSYHHALHYEDGLVIENMRAAWIPKGRLISNK